MMEIIAIIICLGFNALLAGSETAFIAASRSTLKELAKKGDERASQLLLLRESPERTLSVIQLGITFVGALAAALGGAGAEEMIAPAIAARFHIRESAAEILAILLVVIPLTFFSVVVGELVPKALALKRPLLLASKAAPWLLLGCRLLNPIVTAFEWTTKKLLNLFFKKQVSSEEQFREEGLSAHLDILSPANRQYVFNLVKIEKAKVEEVMIHWKEVIYVESSYTIEQVEKIAIAAGHTRLPVMKEEEVLGIINIKEMFAFQKTGSRDWLSLLRQVPKISKQVYLLAALQLLQEKRAHMAIVYAGSKKVGIVTMEAIFEEIIGDIYDEDDDGTLKRILDSIHFKAR